MPSGNFLYPWARNRFLTQQPATLAWNSTVEYKVMFLNAGVNTQYVWSGTGASGYAWNPAANNTDNGTTSGATPSTAGYAITWLSQIPTGHRTMSASYGGIAGAANSLGITATSYGDGIANASAASTTCFAVQNNATVNAFVLYRQSATVTPTSSYTYDGAMELIAFFDSAIGMPVTGNGGDITIVWDTSINKIFKL